DSRLGRELIAGGSRYHAHFVPDEDATADLYEQACQSRHQPIRGRTCSATTPRNPRAPQSRAIAKASAEWNQSSRGRMRSSRYRSNSRARFLDCSLNRASLTSAVAVLAASLTRPAKANDSASSNQARDTTSSRKCRLAMSASERTAFRHSHALVRFPIFTAVLPSHQETSARNKSTWPCISKRWSLPKVSADCSASKASRYKPSSRGSV